MKSTANKGWSVALEEFLIPEGVPEGYDTIGTIAKKLGITCTSAGKILNKKLERGEVERIGVRVDGRKMWAFRR